MCIVNHHCRRPPDLSLQAGWGGDCPCFLVAAAAAVAVVCAVAGDLFHGLSRIVGVDRPQWSLLCSSPICQAGKAIVVGALKDCFQFRALGL